MNKRITDAFEPWLRAGPRPRIGFGLQSPDPEILDCLRRARRYADIVLVGPRAIIRVRGLDVLVVRKPEETLATLLVNGSVQGIIRGTVDDFTTYTAYKKLTGVTESLQPALIEVPNGRQFFLTTISNPEGWSRTEKYRDSKDMADFLRRWGIREHIGVMAAVRHETYQQKKRIRTGIQPTLNRTYADAQWAVRRLVNDRYRAAHRSIDFDSAISSGDTIITPVNGLVGNQMYRAMAVCGAELLCIPRLRTKHFYIDGVRSQTNYLWHVKLLVAMIRRGDH